MAGKTVGELLVSMRADLGGLRMDVREMEQVFRGSFANIQNTAANFGRSLASAFGIGLSATAIIQFGRSVVNLGGQLADLSSQTGISVQALSGIKSTLEENGTSVDAFAKGVFKLQASLGQVNSATDPARKAIEQLGLNFDQLRQSSPEDLIKKVTDALAKQENPLNRNAIAQQLMSRSSRELIPGILALAGRFDELKRQGLNEADAKKLDDFGDALTRLGNVMRILAAGPLADFIRAFERFFNLTEEGRLKNSIVGISEEIERLESMLAKRQAASGKWWESLVPKADDKETLDRLKFLKEQLADAGGALGKLRSGGGVTNTPFTPPVDDAAAKKYADAVKRVNDETLSFIDGLKKENLGLETSQMAVNLTAEEIKKFELEQEKAAFTSKVLRDGLVKSIPPELLAMIDQWNAKIVENTKKIADEKFRLEQLAATTQYWIKIIEDQGAAEEKQLLAQSDARDELTKFQQQASIGLIKDNEARKVAELTLQFEDLAEKIRKLGIVAGVAPTQVEDLINQLQIPVIKEIQDVKKPQTEAEKLGEEIGNALTQGLKNTLLGIETGTQTLGEGMKNLLRNMLLELQGMVFDKAILAPLKMIAEGFVSGLVGALDTAANDQLKNWAKGIGENLRSWIGTGISAIGSLFGSSVDLSTSTFSEGSFPTGGLTGRQFGGMLPSFAGGGLFIGHGGEFVMQKRAVDSIGADKLVAANQSGKLPGSGGTAVTVEINGDITPRQPNMSPDQVVRVTAGNITNDGMIMSAIEQRLRLRGK